MEPLGLNLLDTGTGTNFNFFLIIKNSQKSII